MGEKPMESKGNNIHSAENTKFDFLMNTNSEAFKKTLSIAKKAAKSNVNILILGESGVGKEILAKYIHDNSLRRNEAFVPINCQGFSESLLDSELFGHERGSFTGAISTRKGRFEMADKGTLFLDEVGDIPTKIQVKLLRVLETKLLDKIGKNNPERIDFRLICATNQDLKSEIICGDFREDFFYRISTIVIKIPALRERKEDLKLFIDYFIKEAECQNNIKVKGIVDKVKDFLYSYEYPGNIRELKNIVDRLVVLSEDGILVEEGLPLCVNYSKNYYATIDKEKNDDKSYCEVYRYTQMSLKEAKKEFEKNYIIEILKVCGGNITLAAKKMEISRRHLTNKVLEYEIDVEELRSTANTNRSM